MTAARPHDVSVATVGEQLTPLSGTDSTKIRLSPNTKFPYSVRVFYF